MTKKKNKKPIKKVKRRIILFIITIFLFVFCIFYINYTQDVYNVFLDKAIDFDLEKREIVYLKMKINKHKNDTLFIGSSELHSTFMYKYKTDKLFNIVSIGIIGMKEIYELLTNYLELHPETKNVYIYVPYSGLLTNQTGSSLPEFNKNITKEEIQLLLFSKETTIKSLKKIKSKYFSNLYLDFKENGINNLLNKIKKYFKDQKEIINAQINDNTQLAEIKQLNIKNFGFIKKNNNFYYVSNPNGIMVIKNNEYKNIENQCDETLIYTDKIIELLEQKGIKYKFIIPPYTATQLAIEYSIPQAKESIEKFKKHIVNKGINIYDFAFVNKYTEANIINGNFLYYSPDHPSFIWGIKIFKVLYDPDNAEKDICIILDKDNIDTYISIENELLDLYIENNQDVLDYYWKIINSKLRNAQGKKIKLNLSYLPNEYMKEIKYFHNKMDEIMKDKNHANIAEQTTLSQKSVPNESEHFNSKIENADKGI